MHSAQRKTLEGEILLPMLPCWQLASGGNGSWDDYAFYIGCSPALCFFSVPCGKLRRPTNFHNIYWFWDAKTTSGYQQYVNVAHGGFPKPSKLRGVMGLVCSSFPKMRCRIVFHFGTGSCWVHAKKFWNWTFRWLTKHKHFRIWGSLLRRGTERLCMFQWSAVHIDC